jgi:hypothetical protein
MTRSAPPFRKFKTPWQTQKKTTERAPIPRQTAFPVLFRGPELAAAVLGHCNSHPGRRVNPPYTHFRSDDHQERFTVSLVPA